MIEFNPDGSIKFPDHLQKAKQTKDFRMKTRRCITVHRDLIYNRPPKKCRLTIQLSDAIQDSNFMDNIYKFFKQRAETPTKLNKITEKEFELEVGTNFKRCSDCNSFVSRLRDYLDGNLIDDKGTCTFKTREFCYEDYFD